MRERGVFAGLPHNDGVGRSLDMFLDVIDEVSDLWNVSGGLAMLPTDR